MHHSKDNVIMNNFAISIARVDSVKAVLHPQVNTGVFSIPRVG